MYQNAKGFFESFIQKYDLNDKKDQIESYGYKYHHTYRVVQKMEELMEPLSFSEEEKDLAKTIAIFHDLGRFHQLEKTSMYDDVKTNFDHAFESVKILEEYGWFEQNHIPKEKRNVILFAIINHNKYHIAKTNDKKAFLFANLIRDADKLVILEEQSFDQSCSNISEKVMADFLEMKLLDRRDIKTQFDDVLYYLAFLFDLYYGEAIDILEKTNVLNPYFVYLKKYTPLEVYEMLEKTVKKYINERKKEEKYVR